MQPQRRKHIGPSPPSGEDTPDRRQVQRRENEGGTSAKSSVLILTCVPLPHLVLPLSGWPAQAPRQGQHEVRQGDTHDSGSVAIRGVPLPSPHRNIADGPVRVKALRVGRRSGPSCITGVCRHDVPTLRSQTPITATTHIHQLMPPNRTSSPTLPDHMG